MTHVIAEPVHFRLDLTQPGSEMHLALTLADPPPGDVRLTMPRWAPGSYLIREFARHVNRVTARRGGEERPVRRTAVDEWTVEGGQGPLEVSYTLHASDLSVRTNYLGPDRALVSGAATFLLPEGRAGSRFRVEVVQPPAWPEPQCALPFVDGAFEATDHDALVDAPLAAGPCEVAEFDVLGVPHRVALYGDGDCRLEALVPVMKRTCEAAAAVFSNDLPCERYLFILEVGCGGGLEHANSSVCGFPMPGFGSAVERRKRVALIAHEYFHLWNVKRIRPRALGPFDYRREVHTPHLWVAEGLTSYYQHLLGLRAGLFDAPRLVSILLSYLVALEQTPGRFVQSVEDSSFDAWIKLYRPDENSRNSQVSYYAVGAVVGLALDLAIRHRTAGARGLDDALRTLWRGWRERPELGFDDAELRDALAEAAGERLDDVLDGLVRTPGELDVAALLSQVGLGVERRAREDVGGWLGLVLRPDGGRLVVDRVVRDGPAWSAGLTVGEELLALDGLRLPPDPSPPWLGRRQPGESAVLTSVLGGRLREVPIVLGTPPTRDWRVLKLPGAVEQARCALESWLGVAWECFEPLDEGPEEQRPLKMPRSI